MPSILYLGFLSIMILLSGCSIQRSMTAKQAKTDLIGMTKAEILGCAGVPTATTKDSNIEVLSYAYAGDGKVYSGYGGATITQRKCGVNLTLLKGIVSRVTYSGRTGGLLTEGEQCAFIIQECVK